MDASVWVASEGDDQPAWEDEGAFPEAVLEVHQPALTLATVAEELYERAGTAVPAAGRGEWLARRRRKTPPRLPF